MFQKWAARVGAGTTPAQNCLLRLRGKFMKDDPSVDTPRVPGVQEQYGRETAGPMVRVDAERPELVAWPKGDPPQARRTALDTNGLARDSLPAPAGRQQCSLGRDPWVCSSRGRRRRIESFIVTVQDIAEPMEHQERRPIIVPRTCSPVVRLRVSCENCE
jgi:hypothetical protein